MKIPLLITIFILLLKTTTSAQTVDFAIKVTESAVRADKTIRITESVVMAEEVWYLVGACSNIPNLTIKITERVRADKTIKISRSVMEPSLKTLTSLLKKGTKSVCITNANDLDKETQEKLKLR